jgi:hypothetical protein
MRERSFSQDVSPPPMIPMSGSSSVRVHCRSTQGRAVPNPPMTAPGEGRRGSCPLSGDEPLRLSDRRARNPEWLELAVTGQAALECATAISRLRTRCRRLCFVRENHSLSITRGRHPCGAPTSGAIMGPVVRPTNQGFALSRFGRLDDGCAAPAVARLWQREPRSTATGQALTPRKNAPQRAFLHRHSARLPSRR